MILYTVTHMQMLQPNERSRYTRQYAVVAESENEAIEHVQRMRGKSGGKWVVSEIPNCVFMYNSYPTD